MVICLINWTHNMAGYRAQWWCHTDWVRLMSWVLFIGALDSPSCYIHRSHPSCTHRCSFNIFFQWQVLDSPAQLTTEHCLFYASNGSLSSKRRDTTEITSTSACMQARKHLLMSKWVLNKSGSVPRGPPVAYAPLRFEADESWITSVRICVSFLCLQQIVRLRCHSHMP